MPKLLLRVQEAADALGVSRSTVYALVAEDAIPSVRVGRLVRIPVDRRQRWIDQRSTGPVDDWG